VGASGGPGKVGEHARGGLLSGVVGAQQVGHRGVLGPSGVGQRRSSPAVGGRWPGPGVEQESDRAEVSLGGGQVQRGAAVVIGGVGVAAGGQGGPQFVQVALAGRIQQPHGPGDLGFVFLAARIPLAGVLAHGQ
jgi:hypothetical protein